MPLACCTAGGESQDRLVCRKGHAGDRGWALQQEQRYLHVLGRRAGGDDGR